LSAHLIHGQIQMAELQRTSRQWQNIFIPCSNLCRIVSCPVCPGICCQEAAARRLALAAAANNNSLREAADHLTIQLDCMREEQRSWREERLSLQVTVKEQQVVIADLRAEISTLHTRECVAAHQVAEEVQSKPTPLAWFGRNSFVPLLTAPPPAHGPAAD